MQYVGAARERLSLLEAQLQELRCAQEGEPGDGDGGPLVDGNGQQEASLASGRGASPRRADGVLIAEIVAAQRDLLLNASKRVHRALCCSGLPDLLMPLAPVTLCAVQTVVQFRGSYVRLKDLSCSCCAPVVPVAWMQALVLIEAVQEAQEALEQAGIKLLPASEDEKTEDMQRSQGKITSAVEGLCYRSCVFLLLLVLPARSSCEKRLQCFVLGFQVGRPQAPCWVVPVQ